MKLIDEKIQKLISKAKNADYYILFKFDENGGKIWEIKIIDSYDEVASIYDGVDIRIKQKEFDISPGGEISIPYKLIDLMSEIINLMMEFNK